MVTTELHMFPFLVQVLLVHKTEIIHSPNSHRKTMNVSQRKETDKSDIKKNHTIIISVEIYRLQPKGCYEKNFP